MRKHILTVGAVVAGVAVVGVSVGLMVSTGTISASNPFASDVANEFSVRQCPTCPKKLMHLRIPADGRDVFICEDCNNEELKTTLAEVARRRDFEESF